MLPFLSERRGEGRGGAVMLLQLPLFLDSFQQHFSASIVVQFECSKRLPLNEHHEAF